jgi:hypothetical protein
MFGVAKWYETDSARAIVSEVRLACDADEEFDDVRKGRIDLVTSVESLSRMHSKAAPSAEEI